MDELSSTDTLNQKFREATKEMDALSTPNLTDSGEVKLDSKSPTNSLRDFSKPPHSSLIELLKKGPSPTISKPFVFSPPSTAPGTPGSSTQTSDLLLPFTPEMHHSASLSGSQGSTPFTEHSSIAQSCDLLPSNKRGATRGTKRTRSDEVMTRSSIREGKSGKRSKSESGGSSKKGRSDRKTSKSISSTAVKDIGRWRPLDDLLLISAVEQTQDLIAVHEGVKFSCKFTLKEIETRWKALLFDKHISKLAGQAIRLVQPGVLASEVRKVPWSDEEENILASLPSTNLGELRTFQNLLDNNPDTFHASRTAKGLQYHWALMRHTCLLCDQEVGKVPAVPSLSSFTDWVNELEDSDLSRQRTSVEEALDQELAMADRQIKREISILEEELQQLEAMMGKESVVFKPNVIALFVGQSNNCYEMKTPKIVIGRGSQAGDRVDIDLMREMPNNKVSRKQAIVRLEGGELMLENFGRKSVYVNGKPILPGHSVQLENRQVVEICSIVLTVYIRETEERQVD